MKQKLCQIIKPATQVALSTAMVLTLITGTALADPDRQPDIDGGGLMHPPGMMHPMGMEAGPMMGPMHDMIPPILHGVDLSEKQKDDVFKIMHAQIPSLREQGKTLRQAREALQVLVTSDQYDRSKAQQLANDMAKSMAALTLLKADTDAQLIALLTQEQRKQVRDNQAEKPGKWGRFDRN